MVQSRYRYALRRMGGRSSLVTMLLEVRQPSLDWVAEQKEPFGHSPVDPIFLKAKNRA